MWKRESEETGRNVMMETEVGVTRCEGSTFHMTLKMEGGHESRNAGGLWNMEKGRKQAVSSRASQKEPSPAHALILAQWDSFWLSYLQNCKIINVYYLSYQHRNNLLQQHWKTNTVGDGQTLDHYTEQCGGSVHQWIQLWETKYHRSWRGNAKSVRLTEP